MREKFQIKKIFLNFILYFLSTTIVKTKLSKKIIQSLLSSCLLLVNNAYCYSPYSTPELDELEQEFVKAINQSNQVLREPLAVQYLNHIGQTLAKNSEMKAPLFFIVKSDEINAFAGPGGYIGINTELILKTETESELAAVMAHELAHVRQHHLYNLVVHEEQKKIPMIAAVLASIALGVINPTLGSGALMASLTGFAQDSINFTRSKEKEADRIGMDMLKKANYDPKGMVSFFKKMQQHSRYYYTRNIPAILRTHPLDEERIAEAENRLTIYDNKDFEVNHEYYLFKELVRNHTIRDRKVLQDFYNSDCLRHNTKNACIYGKILLQLKLDKFKDAENNLLYLLEKEPENTYFILAYIKTLTGLKEYEQALELSEKAFLLNTKNYAATLSYIEALTEANKLKKANQILLKARRVFKKDLHLCEQHAQMSFQLKNTAFAYFTQAECELIQGDEKRALYHLKLAEKLTNKDAIMQERIQAKILEIQA